MPSKRKKNKRRMRRVQAQRRALEEQHAANPPVKASRGIAVSAPPAGTTKKAAKAPAPEKISQPILVAVPIAETPKLEPIAEPVTESIPVEVQAPVSEAVLLEQIPAEVPTPATEEAPAVETPSVEPSTVEAAIVQEPEPEIPATEVIPPSEAPVVAPSETQIHTVDAEVIKTETQQTEDVYEAPDEVDAKAPAGRGTATEAEVEVSLTEDIAAPKPVTEAAEKTAVEALSSDRVSAEAEPAPEKVVTETAAESVVEVITDTPEHERHERVTDAAVGPAAPAAEEEELLAEEDAPAAKTEVPPDHAPVESLEMPAVPDTNPEAPVREAEAKEATAAAPLDATPVDEFVVTESVSAVEVATESAAVQQEILPTSGLLSTQTDSTDAATSEAEPSAAPAKETVIDAAEPTRLDRLSEESESETRDLQCQMQISVESVQLNSADMPVETALNAHIVPEVSIEG